MRFINKFTLAIAVFVLLAGTAADAQTFVGGKRPKTLEGMESKIYSEIAKLPEYGLFDYITYQVNGHTVVLSGSTISLGTRSGAERVVKRVRGVEHVINNIRELPPSPADDRIRRQLARELGASGGLSRYLFWTNPPVRLIVDGGRVSLEGFVENRGDANTMNVLANGVPGVFTVTNNIQVLDDRVG
jgi:hyperosmotically inducible protein